MVFNEMQIGTFKKVPKRVFLRLTKTEGTTVNVPLDLDQAKKLIKLLKKWIDDQK